MFYLTALLYLLITGFCAWRIWQGHKTRAHIVLLALSVLFLLNALHWGFIFTNEGEGALTSFGAVLRFTFGALPPEPAFGLLVRYSILRLVSILGAGYLCYFLWRQRAPLLVLLKQDNLQKPFMAGAIFLSFSLMGILTGAALVHVLAALVWGATVYLWPKEI